MGVVVFASDAKGLSSVNSTITELLEQGVPTFALISQETQLMFPGLNNDKFQVVSNMPNDKVQFSRTLGAWLPFKPQWLVVQRERWNPESAIIEEFKSFGAKVALIEPNAQLLNNAETTLETYSRNRFVDHIDVFFDHSEWIKKQRQLVGFKGNSVVVGNPKYDQNFEVKDEILEALEEHYDIGFNNTMLFSLVNSTRPRINEEFKRIIKETPNSKFYYKPYPGEPFDSKFRNDYHPSFMLPNTQVIFSEPHVWGMYHLCDTHIGCLSSITHASLLLGKKYIDLTKETGMRDRYLETQHIFSSNGEGLENDKAMWMRSFEFNDEQQLRDLLPESLMNDIKTNNQMVWDTLDNGGDLLTLFDDYNDQQTSKRIVKHLTDEL